MFKISGFAVFDGINLRKNRCLYYEKNQSHNKYIFFLWNYISYDEVRDVSWQGSQLKVSQTLLNSTKNDIL